MTAVCTPSPCASGGTYMKGTLNTTDGAGLAYSRPYAIYRPKNLTNAANNQVPMLVLANDSGGPTAIQSSNNVGPWAAVAEKNRFIVLMLAPKVDNGGYCRPTTDADPTSAAS